MIEAFRLGVRSRGAYPWEGLDLAFRDGEAWVIAGPPSSGKTLLLDILRGTRVPDAGDVVVSGESIFRGDPAAARAYRASCGHVPEPVVADSCRTVEGMFLRAALAGPKGRGPDRAERVERLLAMVGLQGVSGSTIDAISMSERVRAYLAAELLRAPAVLYCDGVIAGAGSPFREMLRSVFTEYAEAGNTVVLAERAIPARWVSPGDAGVPAGPFRLFRIAKPPRKGAAG